MASMAAPPPVADLEGRLRLEAQEREQRLRAEMETFKAGIEQKLLIETVRRHKAEDFAKREAMEFATQLKALTAKISPGDMLAPQRSVREVSKELLAGQGQDNDIKAPYAYNSLQLQQLSQEELEDLELDHKELSEDMWGVALMIILRDVPEMLSHSSNYGCRGSHLIRFVYASFMVALNLFLQLAMVGFVSSYIVGKSVWTVQGQYAQFHRDLFTREGEFQEHRWADWDGPRDELCDAVINKRIFLGCTLFLWIGRMLGEFKMCMRMLKDLAAVPSSPAGASTQTCIIRRGDSGDVEVIAMTKAMRSSVYLLVILPKVLVCIVLGSLGCQWLTATLRFSDLVLNALALEFIVGIDENILEFFLPMRIKDRLGSTKLAYPHKGPQTVEQADHAAVDDYVRNIKYFTVCCTITILWVLYLQQVLPFYEFDIEPHCGTWYKSQFSQKCRPFEKNCFPHGDVRSPHDYGVLLAA